MDQTLKLGIIGVGNMGFDHAKKIHGGAVNNLKLTAVCDIDEAKRQRIIETFGEGTFEIYDDYHKMLDAHTVDIVLIAVPHYLHPVMAIEAFEKGYHVISEKPAGVYTSAVRKMNEAAAKSGKAFGIDFNQRTNPLYIKAREIVQSGQLGELRRLVWIITNWYRTQSYYDSGSWRASWGGEGGGVLLNQCPHQLDLWQWIFGMPVKIRATCTVGKYHDIEVEDDAQIYAEYANGATATFITTTGEFPGTNRTEISGSKGKIVIEDGKLKWWKLEKDDREVCKNDPNGFAEIPYSYEEFQTDDVGKAHMGIIQSVVDNILTGSEMISPGYDGINALTISNAAFLSSWTGKDITLPMDEELFEKELNKRVAASDKVFSFTSTVTGGDFGSSFGSKMGDEKNCEERWKVHW